MDKAIETLLNNICVEWGFCIDPETADNLINSQHIEADEFACAVLKDEGLDSELEIEWRRKIRNKFYEILGND